MIRIFQRAFNETEVPDFNTVSSRKQEAGPKLPSQSQQLKSAVLLSSPSTSLCRALSAASPGSSVQQEEAGAGAVLGKQ